MTSNECCRLPTERSSQIPRLGVVSAVFALDRQEVLPRISLRSRIEIIVSATLKSIHFLEAAPERVELLVCAQVPLPNQRGRVASSREQFRQRSFAHGQSIVGIAELKQHIVLMPEALLISARQQARSRWAAEGM